MRQVPTWPGPFSGRGSTFFSSYYERPEDLNTVLLIKFSRCAYTDIFCVCPALSRLSNCNNEIQKTCIGYIDDNACKRVETRDTSGTRPMIPAGVPIADRLHIGFAGPAAGNGGLCVFQPTRSIIGTWYGEAAAIEFARGKRGKGNPKPPSTGCACPGI